MNLGEQFLANFSTVDNFDWTIARSHQFLVGDDAESVVDGGCPIFNRERIVFRFTGRCINCALSNAALDTAAGHNNAKYFWPMISTGCCVDLWRTTKFRSHADHG